MSENDSPDTELPSTPAKETDTMTEERRHTNNRCTYTSYTYECISPVLLTGITAGMKMIDDPYAEAGLEVRERCGVRGGARWMCEERDVIRVEHEHSPARARDERIVEVGACPALHER